MFKAARDMVNVHGGQASFHKGQYEKRLKELKKEGRMVVTDDATIDLRKQALEDSCNKYLGCLFMGKADSIRCRGLMMTQDNANLFGNNDFPKRLKSYLQQLNNHKTPGVPGWKK